MAAKKAAARRAADAPITTFDGKTFSTVEDGSTKIVVAVGAGNEVAVVSLVTWRGKLSLDFRRYYCDDDEKTWLPGRGMRISPAVGLELLSELSRQHTELALALEVARDQ